MTNRPAEDGRLRRPPAGRLAPALPAPLDPLDPLEPDSAERWTVLPVRSRDIVYRSVPGHGDTSARRDASWTPA
jgi:hypothetical protein